MSGLVGHFPEMLVAILFVALCVWAVFALARRYHRYLHRTDGPRSR